MSASVSPTSAASASRRAYDHVKDGVLAGSYAPGTLLTEGAIAQDVGCSRTPVREALSRLESEGLVRLYPKKGALVVPVSAQEAEDVWQARALVETWAAPRAFARGDEVAGHLAELTEQMSGHVRAGDVGAFTEDDRTFHEVIVAAAGNDVLTRLYRSLRERQLCINAVAMRVSTDRMRRAIEDHVRLTELIAGEDEAAFCAATDAHLALARRNISPSEGLR